MHIRTLLGVLWRNRTGPLLVAIQVALSLAVLVNAAHIVHLRLQVVNQPTGIDLENSFWISSEGFAESYDQGRTVDEDLRFLSSLPGVLAATITHKLPQTFTYATRPFAAEPEMKKSETAFVYLGSEKIVDAFGLKLVAGRGLKAEAVTPAQPDIPSAFGKWAPEVVITQALATNLFPRGDALGKIIYVGLSNNSSCIVGIVERMQAMPVGGSDAALVNQVVFVPAIPPGPTAMYVVRTEPGRRDEVLAQVERELARRQPDRFLSRIEAYADTATASRAPARANAVLLTAVTAFVLSITAFGFFGLAMFYVNSRTKEIGVRRAMGARRRHILQYFLLENWLITTAGVAVGCVLALALSVKLARMFQQPPLPLHYLVGGALLLWLIGLLAALFPARRAAAISPAAATRTV
jgi:putative ABC transport system permease protein